MASKCCAEMKELVASFRGGAVNDVKLFLDKEIPDEMMIGGEVPNIIFRFCPYCGKAIQEIEVKKDGSIVGQLSALLANPELEDPNQSLQCRAYLYHDTLEQIRSVIKSAALAPKPTGMFKTG